jgi:hypothetical protein
VAAAAAAPTGAEQSAFSLRWRLQIQPLLLQRAPQQQQLLPTTAGHDSFPSNLHARPQIHHQLAAPPEAEEEMKSIVVDSNGTDPGEEPESRIEKNKEQLKPIALCVFFLLLQVTVTLTAGGGRQGRRRLLIH